MIVVALDNSRPTSRDDLSWGAWVGDGRNCWYDKHQRMCAFRVDMLYYFDSLLSDLQSSCGIMVALGSLASIHAWMVPRLFA